MEFSSTKHRLSKSNTTTVNSHSSLIDFPKRLNSQLTLLDPSLSHKSSLPMFQSRRNSRQLSQSTSKPRPSSSQNFLKLNTLVNTQHCSNIPSGLDTFKLLEVISSKDSHFHIPIPNSIVANCGFDRLMIVDSEKHFKIVPAMDIDYAARHLHNFYAGNLAVMGKCDTPIVILKYQDRKVLEFSMSTLQNHFPDTGRDLVIQKYIMPKGLRVCKYRVVLNEFKKVLIFSNNARVDSKPDKAHFVAKPQSLDLGMLRTAVLHKDIAKAIKKSVDFNSFISLGENYTEKVKNFNMFMPQNIEVEEKEEIKPQRPSARFLTSGDLKRTSLFQGKNQSFAEIIKISEYLWAKIDFYFLDNSKLTELACDFLQDKSGNWFFLKIKYGQTEVKTSYTKTAFPGKKHRLILKNHLVL